MHSPSLGNLSPVQADYTVSTQRSFESLRLSQLSGEQHDAVANTATKLPALPDDGKGAKANRLRLAISLPSLRGPQQGSGTAPPTPTSGRKSGEDKNSISSDAAAAKASSFPVNAAMTEANTMSRVAPRRIDALWHVERILASKFMSRLLDDEGMTAFEKLNAELNFTRQQFPMTMSGQDISDRLFYRHVTADVAAIQEKISSLEKDIVSVEEDLHKHRHNLKVYKEANRAPNRQQNLGRKIEELVTQLQGKRNELEETRRSPILVLRDAHARRIMEISECPGGSDLTDEQRATMAYILLHAPCMGKTDEDVAKVVELDVKRVMDDARHMTKEGVVIEELVKMEQNARTKAPSNNKITLYQLVARLHVQKSPDQVRDAALKTARKNVTKSLERLRSRGTLVQTVSTLLNMESEKVQELKSRKTPLEAKRDRLRDNRDIRRAETEPELDQVLREIEMINSEMQKTPERILEDACRALANKMQTENKELTSRQASIAGYLYLHAANPGMSDEKIAKKLSDLSFIGK